MCNVSMPSYSNVSMPSCSNVSIPSSNLYNNPLPSIYYHQYSNENPQSDCAESDSEIKRSGGRGGGEEGVEGEGLVVLKKERLPIFTNLMPKP